MRRDRVLTDADGGDSGFSLIELLVSIVILGIIIGALGGVMTMMLKVQTAADARVVASRDAQFSAQYFADDVQGAATVATGVTPATCGGAGTAYVEFTGGSFAAPGAAPVLPTQAAAPITLSAAQTTVVSYVQQDASGVGQLVRKSCVNGSLLSTVVVARNVDWSTAVTACLPACTSTMRNIKVTLATLSGDLTYTLEGTRRPT